MTFILIFFFYILKYLCQVPKNVYNIYIYIALLQSSKYITSDYKFQQLKVLDSPQRRLTYLKY